MFHDIYFKNNKTENSPSRLELSPIWYSKLDKNWIFNYLFYKVILNMETVPLLDSVRDLDMIIISRKNGYNEQCTI